MLVRFHKNRKTVGWLYNNLLNIISLHNKNSAGLPKIKEKEK